MTKYALYARLSRSDDDQAASLDHQGQACRRYVADKGGVVVLEERDVQSGLDNDRPGYQRVLTAARAGQIDAAVVWRFDRWGRDTLEALRSLRELADLGIDVVSATESTEDPFVRDLTLLLANRESRVISARVKPVMLMSAKMGRWQSRPPAGYRLVDGKLEPHEQQAPLFAQLFRRAATGSYSVAALRRWAHSVGLTSSTGHAPSRSLVHKWLSNPVYVGDLVYNRRANSRFEGRRARPETDWVVVPDAHPGIVDRETFNAVQTVLATHKRIQGDVRASRWLLTGRLYCGHCGSRMYGRTAGRGHFTYACNKGITYEDCRLRSTGGKALDAWVKGRISQFDITPAVRQRAAELVKEEVARGEAERRARRDNLAGALQKHQQTRLNLARGVMADTIPVDVYRRLEEETATAIRAIEKELAGFDEPYSAPDLSPVLNVLETMDWDALDDEGWRQSVALLVERVEVFGLHDYRIYWTETGVALSRVLTTVRA
jgi:site-specific DNA recombinase